MAIPLAIYLGATAVLHGRTGSRRLLAPIPVVVVLVILVGFESRWIGVPLAIVIMGLLVSVLVALSVLAMRRASAAGSGAA